MNDHTPTPQTPSPAMPPDASGAGPGTRGSWRRRMRRSAILGVLIVISLLANRGATMVFAFGDLKVDIGGVSPQIPNSCLSCAAIPPTLPDPFHPDDKVIAGAQTLPSLIIAANRSSDQMPEDAFIVTVRNTDANPANPSSEPVVFEYRAPQGVVITGMQMNGVNASGPVINLPCEIGTELDPPEPAVCEMGQLPPVVGAITVQIEYYVDRNVERETLLDHDVRAYLTPIGTDANEADNQDHAFTSVDTLADLAVLKSGPSCPFPFFPNNMKAGTCDTFRLAVKNNGPSVSRNVFVGDAFLLNVREGLTFESATVVDTEGSSCNVQTTFGVSSSVLCDLGDINVGDVRNVDVKVCADSDIPDGYNFLNFTAVGSGSLPPPLGINPLIPAGIIPVLGVAYPFTPEPCLSLTGALNCLNNTSVLPIIVNSEADLDISKSVEPAKINAGEQNKYTIKVTNNGPSDVLNPIVKDVLPPGVDYEIDNDSCIVRDRNASGPDKYGYFTEDSGSDPFMGRDGPQDGHDIDNGDPPPLPLPYNAADPGNPFFDISTTGTPIAAFAPNADDGSASVPIGFPFDFYDDFDQTSVWVSTNGYLKFGTGGPDTTDPNNDCPLTDSTPNRAIYAFWDDLNVTGGNVRTRVVINPEDSTQSVFIVQWTDVTVKSSGEQISFQIQLYENTNVVRIVYGPGVGASPATSGQSATAGIEPRSELAEEGGGVTFGCGDDINPAADFLDENLVVQFTPGGLQGNPPGPQDELICRVGTSVKDGAVPAYVDGAFTGFPNLGCIAGLLDLSLPFDDFNITNDKIFEFPDGSTVTHVMKPGDMSTIELQALVDPSLKPGTILTNTAVVTGYTTLGDPTTMQMADNFQPFGGNNTGDTKNLVLEQADLRVQKFGKPDRQLKAGEILTYTIIVDNYGPSWATNTAVKDLIQSSGTFDLIDINSDRRAVCRGLPGPDEVTLNPREWPIKDPPPPFGVNGSSGEDDIPQRLELDCNLADDPDTPEGDEMYAENTMENRLEVLKADGPPNSGRWILTLRVRAREAQSINNTVTALSDAADPDMANNTTTVEHDILASADLEISKTDSGDPFVAGTEFEYYIDVTNHGPSTAMNVVMVDELPLEVSLVSMSQPGPGSCGTVQGTIGNVRVTCNLGAVGVGSTRRITLRVKVDADVPDGTVLWNLAHTYSDAMDMNNRNNITRSRSLIIARADIGVTKIDEPDPVIAGENLQYTITAINHGPSNARDVVVIDELPRHVTFVSAEVVEGSGTCLPLPAGSVTCQLDKLTVGEVNTIVLTVKVDENDTPCDIELTNDVEIVSTTEDPDPDPTPNNDRRLTHVDCRATLAIKKTASDLTPVAGTDLRYTISVTNNGPSVAENVFVIDTLPAEQTYRLDDFGCGNSLLGGGCNIGDLAVGQTVSFDVVVAIDSDATCGAKYSNRVSADSDNSDRVEASADVVIDCESDLWIRKFGKPDDQVQAGEELTYYVTVTNLGPSDTVPDEVFFRDLLASSGKFTLTRLTSSHDAICDTDNHPPFTPPYNGAIQGDQDMELSCTLKSDLNPNEQWMVEIDVTATQAQTLNNTADVYHAKSKDPNTANNHAEVEHAITDVADLSIEKSDSGDPFLAGTSFSYDLTIVNDGPSPAENVVVVDTLPLGLKVTGITQPGTGSCALVQATTGNPEVSCYLGDLASGDASSARIDVAVDPSMPSGSLLWNEAVVYSDVFDPNTSDNIARARSRIATEADLEVEKVDEPDPVVAGETLTYQIKVRNHGPSDARAVVLTDTLPEGLTVLDVSSVDGSAICRPLPPGSITCDIGTLPAGAGESIVIVTRVDPGLACGTDLLNVASATSATDEPNPDPSPNADTRMTDVDCLARLKVTKTPSTYAPVAGDDLVYTISVTNLGPSVAEAVTVKDILPAGMSYLFDTQGCGDDLVGGGCEIADLQPGQTVSFDVVVAVDALAPCRSVLTNRAVVTSPSAASVVAASDVVVNCVSDLRVLKFGKPDESVRAGDILTYTVIVDNLGPSVARGVFLKDVIQASGSFDLLSLESDRDAVCTSEPTTWDKISQRAEIDCTLNDPLEVVEASGNFPNPGRWMVTLSVRAREAQSINNVADAGAVLARDPNPANNRAVVEHAITDVADLSISKTDSGDPFKAGTSFEYLITVDNNGPSSAENVVVDDTLPLGLTVVGISQPGAGSCSTVQQTTGNTQVRCALGTLIDEESRTITIEVKSDPAMTDGAILWNEARVTSDVFDPSNRNNISRARSEIVAEADLKLSKVDEPDPVVAGQALEYRLLVQNMGPSFARDVVISDDLPTGVEVVAVSTQSGRGVCRPLPAGFVTCQFDQLAPGAGESIVISARVAPDLPCGSPLVNTAGAQSSTAEPSPDPSPNTASATTAVECLARLSATKTASTYAPAAGSDLVYTLSVTNHGPSVAEAVTVVDLLPAGMSYLFDTRACGAALFGAGCELGDMAPGETIRFDVAVALAPNAACRSVLTNTATFTSPTAATVVATSDVVVDCTSDLRVLKFGKPDAGVRAGEVLTYTVIVDNLGPSAAQGVFLKDVIQASGTFSILGIQSDRDAVCTTEPPVWTDIVQRAEIDCTLNDPLEVVQASGNFPNPGRWIVTVSVRAREAQSINNVADAGAVLARDPNPANNRGVVEHAITDVADLSISKTDSGDPFKAGSSFDYLITVLNEGPSTAENVVVWDTLPLGLTLVSMSQPGTGSCGTVQATGDNTQVRCNLGSLASGASSAITIEVRAVADLADGSILWNEALVTSDVFDPDNSDNISRARSVIVAEADLGITKTDAPDPVVAGQTIEYRLAVRNNGPSDALGVVVTDDLPEGVQVTGLATLSGRGSCQPLPAGFVTCDLGTLAAGASDEIVITVKVDPAAPCGAGLANQAIVTSRTDEPDPDPSPNSAAATTAVDCRARLRATKTASTYAPVAGGDLVYTLSVTNDGPSVAEAVTVVDVLPAGVSYLFDTRGCGPDLFGAGCELADIAPGASISFDIAVAVAPSAACRTVLSNTATFSSVTADPVVARADVVVNCVSDLRVLKFGKPDDTVRAGEVLTYTIVVDNLGPSVAREVYVKDLVRASGRFTLLGVQSDRDAVCTTEPPVWTGIPEQLEIDCELTDPLDVLHGDSSFPNPGRWNITVQLRAEEAQSINNVADAGAALSTDPNPFNNRGVVEHAITDVADLAITKVDSGGPFTAGEAFTYTLSVSNQGPSTADNVQVIDNLPLGLTVVDISAPAGTACTVVQQVPGNPQVLCNLGHLASGAQASISIQVRADPGLGHGTLLSNQALVQSQVFDPNNRNNVARAQSRIVGVADLGLTKSAGPNPVIAGENLDYVLTVTNHGSSTAHDVVVTDQLPAGVAVVSMGVLNAPGFCQPLPPGSVTCQLGTLEPGAVRAVSVSVRVDPSLQCGSNLVNQAAVTSTTAEPVPDTSPNSAGTTTGVGCRPRLRVSKTVSEFLPVAGRNLTYTIRVQNDGPSTATDVVLVDDLPDGVSYRLDSRGCGLGLTGAGCPLGDLAPGAVVSLDVVVYVHPDAPCGMTLTNRATASAPNAAPASGAADVVIECANDLRVLKFAKPDGTVQAGGVLTYTVIVDNLGPSHAPGVALKDVLRSSGSFDLIDIVSDRDMDGCLTEPGATGGGGTLDDPLVKGARNSLDIDCTLSEPLGVLAADGFPNPGRWTLTMRVRATEAQSLNNAADAVSVNDPDYGNNRAVVEREIIDVADLSVVKTDLPDCAPGDDWPGNFCDMQGNGDTVVPAGSRDDPDDPAGESSFHYRLTVHNAGPSAADNVVVTDSLPKEIRVTRIRKSPDQGTCSTVQGALGQPVVNCNLGRLASGATVEIDIFVHVPADVADGTILWNEVSVGGAGIDPDNGNNLSRSRTDVIGVADLSIRKNDSPDPAVAGDEMVYTIDVENHGPSVARGVTIVDDLPGGLSATSVDVVGVTDEKCSINPLATDSGRDQVTCELGDIAVGRKVQILILADIAEDIVGADEGDQCVKVDNSVEVTAVTKDPDTDDNNAGSRTDICAQADLKLTKTSAPEKVNAGEQKKYTLTVENLGPSAASGVTLVDVLPDAVAYEVDTNAAMCTRPSNLVAFRAALNTASEIPNPSGPDSATGLATFVYDTNAQVLEYSVFVNDMTSAITGAHIHQAAAGVAGPVVLDLFTEPAAFDTTHPLVVKRTLTAPEIAVLGNVLANPAGYYVNVHTSQNPAGEIRGQMARTANSPLRCEIGALAAGASYSFDIFVKINPDTAAGTSIVNTALVFADAPPDKNLSNNAAQAKNLVLTKSDLRVVKFGKRDASVRAGDILTYTIIVDNLGPSAADGVALKDVLRASGKFDVVNLDSDRDLTCTSNPNPISGGGTPNDPLIPNNANDAEIDCTLDTPLGVLSVGDFPNPGRWIVTLRVRANETQSINNVADVVSGAVDPNTANNHAEVEHDITDVADLAVTKTGPMMVVAGEPIGYTVVVTNRGPSTAENVVVYDRLPAGIVVSSSTVVNGQGQPAGSCTTGAPGDAADKLTCGLGTLGVGQQRTVTILATVDPGLPAGTTLENDAFALSDVLDDDNSNNFAHVLTTVKSRADLSVTKTSDRDDDADATDDGEDAAVAGQPIEYTVKVRNNGVSDAANVQVVDGLPAGTSFLGAEITVGSGVCVGLPTGQVKCQLGVLAAGAMVEIVIRARVEAGVDCDDQPFLVNQVEVTSPSETDPASLADNSYTLTTPLDCRADLVIEKWSDPVKVNAGEQKRYTVRTTNLGPSDAVGIVVIDTLPPEVDYEINTGGCAVALGATPGDSDVVTCDVGTLPPGGVFQFDIYAKVKPYVAAGTEISNTATVASGTDDPNLVNNTATSKNLVLQKADLYVRKFGKPDGAVRAGDVLTYTVIIDNLGPSWADGVALKDVLQSSANFDLVDIISDRAASCRILPQGTTPIDTLLDATAWPPVEPPQAFGVDPASGVAGIRNRLEVDCTLADPLAVLKADGPPNSGRWIITMRIRAAQTQDVNNVAETLSEAADPNPANNSAFVEHDITDVADLSITKSDSPDPVVAGQTLTYVITVTNKGPSDAENVGVLDRLPPGIVVKSATAAGGGSCTTGAAGNPLDKLACSLGTLRPQQSRTITVVTTVLPGVREGTVLENDALVFSDVFDDDNSNNFAHTLTTVGTVADLDVQKVGDPDGVKAGEVTTFDIFFRNNGPSVARDVILVDELPAELDLLRAYVVDGSPVSDSATCFQRTEDADPVMRDTLTCELGDIAPGQSGQVVVVALVQSRAPAGIVTNNVAISSDTPEPDPDSGPNTASYDLEILPMADLWVQKWSDPIIVNAGERKRYTVKVTNLGPSDAVDVTMTDTLPTAVDYEIDTGLCDESLNTGPGGADVVTCRFGTLKPGESRLVDIYTTVRPNTAPDALITNRAVVTSATPDGINQANNTATSENRVKQKADLKVTKFGKNDGKVRAAEILTYTVIVDNLGPSWANAVAIKDVLQTAGKFDLIDITSDRAASCKILPLGLTPINAAVPATAWPITTPPPANLGQVNPPTGAANVDQRVEVDCTLAAPLEVLAADGPPNSGRWIVTMRVRARQAQSVNNVVTVTSAIAADPDPSNNMAIVEHEITDVADLTVVKTAIGEVVTGCLNNNSVITPQADMVTAGLKLTYKLVVTNNGPSDAENVVVYDRLPSGVVVIGGTVDDKKGGGPSAAKFASWCATGAPGSAADKLTCGLGTLGPVPSASKPNTMTIEFTVRVDPGLATGTTLENDAFVASDMFDPVNRNWTNNLSTVKTSADLELVKSHDPATVTAGDLLRYTLKVTNAGPSVARDVTLYDELPAQVSFLSAVGASCTEDPVSPGDLSCRIGDMAPGEVRYIYLIVRVAPDAPTSIVNNASVQSGFSDDTPVPAGTITPDPCPADNVAADTTLVIRKADVVVTKVDLNDPVIAGKTASYLITFRNLGPSTATGVNVRDTLPAGFTFNRCESIDPNDKVTCTAAGQVVTLGSILEANTTVFQNLGPLDPGRSFAFVLVADVSPGYVLDGLTSGGAGGVCQSYAAASGYLFWAADKVEITAVEDANQAAPIGRNNFDDECTRVNAEADLSIDKTDIFGSQTQSPGNYFLQCDPVQPGGMITYDLTITNNGMSDAAQVQVVDQLPADFVALAPAQVRVSELVGSAYVEITDAARIEKRDDGKITVIVGNDPRRAAPTTAQRGRLNAGSSTKLRIQVMVANPWGEMSDKRFINPMPPYEGICGAQLVNTAMVQTIKGPTSIWPTTGQTPTLDPNAPNNADSETTTIECPAINVEKTVSFDGKCPGRSTRTAVPAGQKPTFCFEITNVGTTYLDAVTITDTLRTSMGNLVIYTETITFGKDRKFPIAPGETVKRQIESPPLTGMCGTVTNSVEVAATPVNSGRTPYPCLAPIRDADAINLDVPCGGADYRLALPALDADTCETFLQIQNVGDHATKAIVVIWGEAGACEPQAAGPLKMECTGLLRPGSAWTFPSERIPPGSASAIVYSMNASDSILTPQGNPLPFADVACRWLFDIIVGDDAQWIQFDQAYRNGGVFLGPFGPGDRQLTLDFGAHPGEPLAVSVNRTCPDPTDPNRNVSAAYSGISSEREGVYDPVYGGYAYYAPLVFANKGGLSSLIHIQNLSIECSSLELWFKGQDNCMRPILGDVMAVAPGESVIFDPNTVVGPDWIGSAWIRSSGPMAIVVDSLGPNHFTSYTGVPSDSDDAGFSLGSLVNYAPLIYSEYQGWDAAIQVQNLSGTTAAKVKVYFLDRSGDVITTVVDWVCPRGSQTFFLPVIAGIPGSWVGSARVESQEWWTPGTKPVDPPRVQSVVLLEKWSDPARSERREAVAYNALTEQLSYTWQVGKLEGGTQSGSAVIAVPILAKGNRNINSELAITNLVAKPGFTDFAIYLYDQNGLLDHVCQKLHNRQVEYIDLAVWGYVPQRFLGSAVISATFWEHEVFSPTGNFTRNLVGLGAVIVERIGGTLGGPDVPGDESKAFEGIPIFDQFHNEKAPDCGPNPR